MIQISDDARIWVAGDAGLVGSAIVRRLRREGFTNLLHAEREDLDLRNQAALDAWFRVHEPEYVFLAAGTVGGILPNSTLPAQFIYDNLMIHANVCHAAHVYGVEKLLYLGSSCIYPRDCRQPMREEDLLTGPLEPTNEYYAIAKIAGVKLCSAYRMQYGCDFISAMPTNLYGPGDSFDLDNSHVLPALMRKFHEAKLRGDRQIIAWGSGTPLREFLHVDDLADCCLFLMRNYDGESHINVGSSREISIREVAELLREIIHPAAELVFDRSKPDGMHRKRLDVSRLHALGWRHQIDLRDGLETTYAWFEKHYEDAILPRSVRRRRAVQP